MRIQELIESFHSLVFVLMLASLRRTCKPGRRKHKHKRKQRRLCLRRSSILKHFESATTSTERTRSFLQMLHTLSLISEAPNQKLHYFFGHLLKIARSNRAAFECRKYKTSPTFLTNEKQDQTDRVLPRAFCRT